MVRELLAERQGSRWWPVTGPLLASSDPDFDLERRARSASDAQSQGGQEIGYLFCYIVTTSYKYHALTSPQPDGLHHIRSVLEKVMD